MAARPVSPVLAPFAALARDLADLVRNPAAFAGGLAGTTLCIAGALALTLYGGPADAADPVDDDLLVLEFDGGLVMRKGPAPNPDAIPEKPIVDDQRAVDSGATNTVTVDPTTPPDPPKPQDPKPKPKPSRDPVDPNQQGRDSDRNVDGNNTYNDKPNADELPGDPFGSPDGWADRAEKGDKWATDVLAALSGLTVGSYAGVGQDVVYKFQIIVCADGRVEDVRTKGSTGKPDFDGQLRNAVERIKLPKAPPDVAKQLAGGCKKIPYIFTWSGKQGGGVQ